MRQTILVRITGLDRPGIITGVFHILNAANAEVVDMEQIVIHDRIIFGLLVSIDPEKSPLKDLLFYAWERDLTVDLEATGAPPPPEEEDRQGQRHAVTVIARELRPEGLAAVTDAIVLAGGNILRINRLGRYPVTCFEMLVEDADYAVLKSELLDASSDHRVDVAVEPEGLSRRAKRLIVIDMDATLIRDEVIDRLAAQAGVEDQVSVITEAAMRGDMDFSESLIARVKLLEGMTIEDMDRATERIRLTPGARTLIRTLKRIGYKTAILSGGFEFFAEKVREELDVDYAFANKLEIVDGVATGALGGPIIDGAAKASALRHIAEMEDIPLDQTVAVGDGANDRDMLALAGLGIAFNAKPVVDDVADTSIKVPFLDAVLFILGIRRADIEQADRI